MRDTSDKEKQPLISVVIPVYNVERYLSACVDSCLGQSYQETEILLVDDGSTDASGRLCDLYAAAHAKIRVIHQKNGGLSAARNTGLRNAKGEYVFFADSDDCLHPRLLEIAEACAGHTKARLVQVDIRHVAEDFVFSPEAWPLDLNDLWEELARYDALDGEEKKRYRGEHLFCFDAAEGVYNLDKDNQRYSPDIRLSTTVAWTKLYRREIFSRVMFPESIRLHEDQMTAHRFIQAAGGMTFVRYPLYEYRTRKNSLITDGWSAKRLTILDCYADRLKTAKEITGFASESGLVRYIYYRYLVCIFQNFRMAGLHMEGKERETAREEMLARMRAVLREGIRLPLVKRLFFGIFLLFPVPVADGYTLWKRLRK